MSIPTVIDLETLRSKKGRELFSLYIPTSGGKDISKDKGQLAEKVTEIEHQLGERGYSPEDSQHFLKSLRATMNNEFFWQNLKTGLAMFLSSDIARYYAVPAQFEQQLILSDHFILEPLEPFATPALGMPR